MKIRVIIPCFNEGKVVKKTYDRLTEILTENSKTRRYYYDLLFIDDGSKDNTIEHIQHLAEYDEHVKYISFSRNFGKEAAMIAGFQHSVNVDAVVSQAAKWEHLTAWLSLWRGSLIGYSHVPLNVGLKSALGQLLVL